MAEHDPHGFYVSKIAPGEGPQSRLPTSDLIEAIAFLRGRYIDNAKKSEDYRRGIRKRSDAAREAIVRLLTCQGDVDRELRVVLANVFAPDDSNAGRESDDFRRWAPNPPKGCMVEIKHRKKSRPTDGPIQEAWNNFRKWQRDLEIGENVAQEMKTGILVKMAIGRVAAKRDISDSAVKKSWTVYDSAKKQTRGRLIDIVRKRSEGHF